MNPLDNLRACTDRLGVLSCTYAPSTAALDAFRARLAAIDRAVETHQWVRVTEGLIALKGNVASFVSRGVRAAVVISEAHELLFAAMGFVQTLEAAGQVRWSSLRPMLVSVGGQRT